MSGPRLWARVSVLATLALLALYPGPAAARTWVRADMKDQVKGCSVTLYEDPHFHGARWTTTNGWAAIGWEFNDKVSSVRVRSGIWQFFRNDNFEQQIETLYPGSYAQLQPSSDNAISSFRCIRAT